MIQGDPVWRSDREGLLVGDGVVSFQRYLCPSSKMVLEAPSSYGALPVWPEGDHFLLALPLLEAFWVGVLLPKDWENGTMSIAIVNAGGMVVSVEHFAGPGLFVLPGIKRSDGQFDVFSQSMISALQLDVAGNSKSLVVCDPINFEKRTGKPSAEPLDPHAAFGRWLLP
jgi:hypothetical protein